MAIDITHPNRRRWDRSILICFWILQTVILLAMIALYVCLMVMRIEPGVVVFPVFHGLCVGLNLTETILYGKRWLTAGMYLATNILKAALQLAVLSIFIYSAIQRPYWQYDAGPYTKVLVLEILAYVLAFFLVVTTLVYACIIFRRGKEERRALEAISKHKAVRTTNPSERYGRSKTDRPSGRPATEVRLPKPARTPSTNREFFRFDRSSKSRSYATIPEFESSGPLTFYEPHSQSISETSPIPTMTMSWRTSKTSQAIRSIPARSTRSSQISTSSSNGPGVLHRMRASEAARDFAAFKLRLDARHKPRQPSRDLPPFHGTRPLDPKY